MVDMAPVKHYYTGVITTWRHKGPAEVFAAGKSRQVRADHIRKIVRLLDALNVATRPEDMNFPGTQFHRLHGQPQRYAVSVNGPWRITFAWEGENAVAVDLEQYH